MKTTKALNVIYRSLVAYIEDSAGVGSSEAKQIDKAYSLVNSKVSKDRDYQRDLASTTAYVYTECMYKPSFFSDIDKATDIATRFIELYPTNTDWEKTHLTWEETLYEYYKTRIN